MNEKDQYKNRIELLQGTLDMLILQTLQWGPQHGYGIVQALRLQSGDVLQVETGSLYPALHRLERQSWVQSEWKQSESKQKARYYRIRAKGKKQLATDLGRWERIVEAIGSVMYVNFARRCAAARAVAGIVAHRHRAGARTGVCVGTDTHYRPAVVRNRRQRSGHRRFRRHAPGSNVIASMLPSRTSSDAPEPRDRNSGIVSHSLNSTRIARILRIHAAPLGWQGK